MDHTASSTCTSPELSTSGGLRRLEYIDGLRALSAVWVVIHHCLLTQEPVGLLKVSLVRRLLFPFYYGQPAVMVFLALSGFCLYYPLVLANPMHPRMRQGYWEFMKRRARRILPPYFAAGILCVALVLLWAPMSEVRPGHGWSSALPVTWQAVGSHLLLVHNLVPGHLSKIDYPMWSVGLEWQLYLFFPVFVWIFQQRRRAGWLLGLLIVMAVTRSVAHSLPPAVSTPLYYGPWGYCLIFALGMQAAQWTVSGRVRVPPWVLALVAVLSLGPARLLLSSQVEWAKDLATGVGAVCILLLAARRGGAMQRVLSLRPLVAVGLYSYSLYLLHAPILQVCWLAARQLGLGPDATFLFLVVGGLPVMLGMSYLFFLKFERPFIGRPNRPTSPSPPESSHESVDLQSVPAATRN